MVSSTIFYSMGNHNFINKRYYILCYYIYYLFYILLSHENYYNL